MKVLVNTHKILDLNSRFALTLILVCVNFYFINKPQQLILKNQESGNGEDKKH